MKHVCTLLLLVTLISISTQAFSQTIPLNPEELQIKEILGDQVFWHQYQRFYRKDRPDSFLDYQYKRYDRSSRSGRTMAIGGGVLGAGAIAAGIGALVIANREPPPCDYDDEDDCDGGFIDLDAFAAMGLGALSFSAGVTALVFLSVGITKHIRSGRIRDQLQDLRIGQYPRFEFQGISFNGGPRSAGLSATISF